MIETYLRILKHDRDGRLVKDSGLMPSHSYVIQFLEFIEGLLSHASPKNATDVDNSEQIITQYNYAANKEGICEAAAGEDAYGIVVGTNAGTSAEDNEDYALDTKILHSGVGEANKLNYQAVTFAAPGVVGPNVDFDISRAFANETGSPITVKEIGLICKNDYETKYHLFLRDVVTDEPVAEGETLTVVYTLRTTA